MKKQLNEEFKRMQQLAGILNENQSERYNLVKNNEEYGDYVDIEMYEDILRKEASLQGVKIDEDKLKEFLEELDFGGFTGEEYRNISSPEILEDYLGYANEEDY
jgi:hypothetical protein